VTKIDTSMIKELRERTGAGMMDCKQALAESEGDIEKSIEYLRKKGLKNIDKRAGKTAAEGTLGVYVHAGEQVAAIVELNCETDFVARGDEFKKVAKDIAMHVAAMRPQFITEEEVPEAIVEKEKSIAMEQLTEVQQKNADKILPGKLRKFFQEVVLLEQTFVKDDKKSVREVLDALSVKVGEKVVVRRFSCLEVGEGIEKEVTNLSDDVAALTGNV
jgi:elongation factor Ts